MKKLPLIAALFVLASGLHAYGQVAAESTTSASYSTTSNAAFDFYVYSPITVDYLGVFDPGGDSLSGPVTVSIYTNLQFGSATLASYTFEPDTTYTQVGNDVFAAITPITLTDPGYTYNGPFVVVTYFGNPQSGPTGAGQTLNTFGGAVAYGDEFSDDNPFQDGPSGASINGVGPTTFNAGTFATGVLPEGGAAWLYLLMAGGVCCGAFFFKRRGRLTA